MAGDAVPLTPLQVAVGIGPEKPAAAAKILSISSSGSRSSGSLAIE